MASNKKKKKRAMKEISKKANDMAVVASGSPPENSEATPKKAKYERKLKVKLAGTVSNFLVLNAVSFRADYEGSGQFTFKVNEDNKSMLDDLCERLTE